MKEVEDALIAFINDRPVGNLLRQIAERTLVDLRNKEVKYVDNAVNQSHYRREQIKTQKRIEPTEVRVSNVNKICAKNLKTIRIKAFMRTVEFSKKFGLKRETYRDYESGKVRTPLELAVNVCIAFGIPIEKFTTTII